MADNEGGRANANPAATEHGERELRPERKSQSSRLPAATATPTPTPLVIDRETANLRAAAAAKVPAARGALWEPYASLAKPTYLDPVREPLRKAYAVRWRAMYPLYRQLGTHHLSEYVYGELLVWLLALLIALATVASGGGGNIASVPMMLAFMTVSHNSLFTLLLGIPFERALFYHKLFAYLAIATGFYHGWEEGLAEFDDEFYMTVTGWVVEGAFLLLFLTSVGFIRRHMFEFFYRMHWLLFSIALVAGFMHGTGAVALGMILWGGDVVIRMWLARSYNPRKVSATALPCDIIMLTFPKKRYNELVRNGAVVPASSNGGGEKSFEYSAGQYIFMCIPALTRWEYHPFSISSAPFEDNVYISLRVLGNWTNALYERVADAGGRCDLDVLIDGPYGAPMVDIWGSRYTSFLLVSGGIGITPNQSVANQLLYEYKCGRPIDKLRFVWSVRDRFMISAMRSYYIDNKTLNETSTGAPGWQESATTIARLAKQERRAAKAAKKAAKKAKKKKGKKKKKSKKDGADDGGDVSYAPAEDVVNAVRLPYSFSPDLLHRISSRSDLRRTNSEIDARRGKRQKSAAAGVPTGGGGDDADERDILETTFHLTRAREQPEWPKGNINKDVQHALRLGRPNLEKVFRAMKAELGAIDVPANGVGTQHHVAVLVCGPAAMIRDVGTLCYRASDKKVRFDFHAETFDF